MPCSNVRRTQIKEEESKERGFSSLAPMNQSFQENQQAMSYCFTIIFLLCIFSETPATDVSVSLSFQVSSWMQSRGCDWTLRAAPELYFEEEAPEPHIMLYSPLAPASFILLTFFSHFVKYLKKIVVLVFAPEQRTLHWCHIGAIGRAWDVFKE